MRGGQEACNQIMRSREAANEIEGGERRYVLTVEEGGTAAAARAAMARSSVDVADRLVVVSTEILWTV